jgi:hypothetical protein
VIFEATPAMLRQKSKARKLWCAIIALSMGIIVFIGILAILRAVQDASVYPTTKPVFPKQYEASISINMPYINLVEPVYVHVDEEKGLQKLSYYGGMLLEVHQKQSYIDVPVYWICSDTDVYIFNTSGISYQVIPVIKDLKCFQTDPQPLQHVFPDLSLFEAQRGVYLIRGKSSYVWKYKTKGKGPTAEGLLGEYSFYVDSKTNQPIRFHYVGRNAMLGGSHIDEYYLDYLYIREGPIDPHTFSALPSIMNCTKLSDYHGPTRMPLQDVSLFCVSRLHEITILFLNLF